MNSTIELEALRQQQHGDHSELEQDGRAGTPLAVLRANGDSNGKSSPMAMVTRGPIHIMALIDETRPTQISAPTMRPPGRRKYA